MPNEPAPLFVGLAIAAILWWVIGGVRRLSKEVGARGKRPADRASVRRVGNVETEHRRWILNKAQSLHLASHLFSLSEILEEPLVLAPPPRISPDSPVAPEDVVTMTVPYMPAWPELAAFYAAPALTLPQALAGGMHVALIGQPGIGKTVALAHLATLAANRSPELSAVRERVPFLLHVGELDMSSDDHKDPLRPFVLPTAHQLSVLDGRKVRKFVAGSFRDGRALVLIDGYDELTDQGQQQVTQFLGTLLRQFPRIQLVVTGAPEYLDGLITMGFSPLAILPWNDQRRARFVRRWLDAWAEGAASVATASAPPAVDTAILSAWLGPENSYATPLELTLRMWAASAGDWLGSNSLDVMDAHIQRLIPGNTPAAALEALAIQVMLTSQPVFDPRSAHAWVQEFELPETFTSEAEAAETQGATGAPGVEPLSEPTTRRRRSEPTAPGLLGKLASTGLLVQLPGNRMRFVHPTFGGYLAGRGLRVYRAGETLVNQPDWIGKLLTMRYFASHADAGPLVTAMLHWSRLPTHRPTLTSARWLRDAALTAPWRSQVLVALGALVREPGIPLALRGQAVAALAASNDPSVALLFRELLASATPDVAHLAALGVGAMFDARAMPLLRGTLLSPHLAVRRAGCLALVAIGTTAALEAVGEGLLRGDDDLRRAAAEALANHPAEGHAMLRDGAGMEDIALRRATAYGLGRIHEQWAMDILEKLRVEDDQWIVRNAASEIVEGRALAIDPRAPRPVPPPSESAWLIRFAGTLGMGISAGAPATDVLVAALSSPHGDERLGAVEYLKREPTEGTVKALYSAMYGEDPELREAAFQAIWEIGASGFHLPDPVKFGFN